MVIPTASIATASDNSHSAVVANFKKEQLIESTSSKIVKYSCIGGIIGYVGYCTSALILEALVLPNLEPPKHTYGQQAGLISAPLSTMIGISGGMAVLLFATGSRRMASLALFATAFVGGFLTFQLWNNDGMGTCNSAIVLYFPIFGMCTILAFAGMLILLLSIILHQRSVQKR